MSKSKGVRAGSAFVEVGLQANLQNGIRQIQRQMRGVSESLGSVGSGLVGAGAGITAAFGGILGALAWPTKLAADMEVTRAGFVTLTKSAEVADSLLGRISKFAAETPFAFPELASSARMLMAFGSSADNVVDEMKAIGDVSSAIGAPINEIAEIYGKARAQGTLFGEDINQLGGRGIPVISELAKQLGVAESEVKKLASEGKVTFSHLETMFKDLTTGAGLFAGGMERASQTFLGRLAVLRDSAAKSIRPIGEAILNTLKPYLDVAASAVSAIGRVIEANAELAPIIAKVAAAGAIAGGVIAAAGVPLLGLAGVFKVLSIAAGAVGTVISGIGTIVGVVSSKFLLPVIAIAAAIAGAVYLVNQRTTALADGWAYVIRVGSEVIGFMKELAGSIYDALSAGNYRQALQILWSAVKVAFFEGTAEILRLYSTTWERAKKYTQEFFSGLLETCWNAFKAIPRLLMAALRGGASLGEILADAFTGGGNGITEALKANAKAARLELEELQSDAAYAAQQAAAARGGGGNGGGKVAGELKERAEATQQAAEAAAQRLQALEDEIRVLQMGQDAADRYKLAQQGATEEQLAAVKALQEQRRMLKEREEAKRREEQEAESLKAEGKQLAESLRTPLEVFADERKRITKLFRSGAIDATTANRAMGAARERYTEDTAAGATATPGEGSNTVAMRGTQAVLDTLRRNAGGDGASQLAPENRWAAPLIENARRQLAAAQQMPERLAGLMQRQQQKLIDTRELERIGNRQLQKADATHSTIQQIAANTKPQPFERI